MRDEGSIPTRQAVAEGAVQPTRHMKRLIPSPALNLLVVGEEPDRLHVTAVPHVPLFKISLPRGSFLHQVATCFDSPQSTPIPLIHVISYSTCMPGPCPGILSPKCTRTTRSWTSLAPLPRQSEG